jgi:hypothetical protein
MTPLAPLRPTKGIQSMISAPDGALPGKQSNALLWGGIVAALLIPPLGWLIAIVLFAKSRSGPAIAVILTSFVGMLLGFMLLVSAGMAEARSTKKQPTVKGSGYVKFDKAEYGEFSIDSKGTPKRASGKVYFRIQTSPDPEFREAVIGRVTCLSIQGGLAHATGVVTEIGEGYEDLRYFDFMGRDDPDAIRVGLHTSRLSCTDNPCQPFACALAPIVDGSMVVRARR